MAIVLEPNSSLAYTYRGHVYHYAEDYDRAIADLTTAIDLKPDLVLAYLQRGYAYEKKGLRAKAIADYWRANRLDPDSHAKALLGNLGVAP